MPSNKEKAEKPASGRGRPSQLKPDQITILEKYYQKEKFVSTETVKKILSETGLTQRSRVDTWFTTRRKKEFHDTGTKSFSKTQLTKRCIVAFHYLSQLIVFVALL